MIHGGLISQQPKFRNLLAQNIFYVIPVVNPDGVAMVEREFFKTNQIVKKRKNMNPQAVRSVKEFDCLAEDSGVDLNRNYGVDWGVGDKDQVGFTLEDACADPCGECYRGKSAFSEPETRAVRDFLIAHKNEVKFVSNFHSYGNMWIYPYNGKKKNTLQK